MICDYGATFVRNISGLPQDDMWLWSNVCEEYIRATTRWYVIMEQSLRGIYQGYHTMIRDYGATFVRNISGLPQDDTWLWSKVCEEYIRATTRWYVIMEQSFWGIYQGYHKKIRDYGAKFLRNMSGLPQDDTWLWSKVFEEYVMATTRWYVIMEQSLWGIYQGYHTMIRDYGAKFVRNMSWLPQDDTWLWRKVCEEYSKATTRRYVIMGQSLSGVYQGYRTMIHDYEAKFVRNISGLPHDDTWLWSKVCEEYIRATTRRYVIMGQSFSGIYQGYHKMIRDYGAKFVRNMSWLPQGDTWLWSKVWQELIWATTG